MVPAGRSSCPDEVTVLGRDGSGWKAASSSSGCSVVSQASRRDLQSPSGGAAWQQAEL